MSPISSMATALYAHIEELPGQSTSAHWTNTVPLRPEVERLAKAHQLTGRTRYHCAQKWSAWPKHISSLDEHGTTAPRSGAPPSTIGVLATEAANPFGPH